MTDAAKTTATDPVDILNSTDSDAGQLVAWLNDLDVPVAYWPDLDFVEFEEALREWVRRERDIYGPRSPSSA